MTNFTPSLEEQWCTFEGLQQRIDRELRAAGIDEVLERQGFPVTLGRMVVGCGCVGVSEMYGKAAQVQVGITEQVGILEGDTMRYIRSVAMVHDNRIPTPLHHTRRVLSGEQLMVVHNSLCRLALAKHQGRTPDLASDCLSIDPTADPFRHKGYLL